MLKKKLPIIIAIVLAVIIVGGFFGYNYKQKAEEEKHIENFLNSSTYKTIETTFNYDADKTSTFIHKNRQMNFDRKSKTLEMQFSNGLLPRSVAEKAPTEPKTKESWKNIIQGFETQATAFYGFITEDNDEGDFSDISLDYKVYSYDDDSSIEPILIFESQNGKTVYGAVTD